MHSCLLLMKSERAELTVSQIGDFDQYLEMRPEKHRLRYIVVLVPGAKLNQNRTAR